MIIPVRCMTCHKVIGDLWSFYIKKVKTLEENNTDNKPIVTGKIMDELGLTRYCCRRHLLANCDFMEVI